MIIFGVLLRCVIFAKWIGAENNYQKADQKVIKDLNDSSGSQFASPKSVGVRPKFESRTPSQTSRAEGWGWR